MSVHALVPGAYALGASKSSVPYIQVSFIKDVI